MSPPQTNPNPPQTEESAPDTWSHIEAELKRAQEALQQPLVDTFVRQSEPHRERTVMDLKSWTPS